MTRYPRPRPATVRLNSWAGLTTHRVLVVGERKDGRYVATWDDTTALRRKRGDRLYPPRESITFSDGEQTGGR